MIRRLLKEIVTSVVLQDIMHETVKRVKENLLVLRMIINKTQIVVTMLNFQVLKEIESDLSDFKER